MEGADGKETFADRRAFLEAWPRARRLARIAARGLAGVSVLTCAREHLWIRDHPAGLRGARTSPDELWKNLWFSVQESTPACANTSHRPQLGVAGANPSFLPIALLSSSLAFKDVRTSDGLLWLFAFQPIRV